MISQASYLLLIQCLAKLKPMDPSTAIALRPYLQEQTLRRGEHLLYKGAVHSMLLFVVSGSVREAAIHPLTSKEETTWMWFSGDFVYTKPGFFSQQPAESRVEAMEDCMLVSIGYKEFVELSKDRADFNPLFELVRDHYHRALKRHALDLVALSNQQRFDLFILAHPTALLVLNHQYIASFLGIRDKGLDRYSGKR